jgi:hypothetical protein
MTNQQAERYAILLEEKKNLLNEIDSTYDLVKTARAYPNIHRGQITLIMDNLNKEILEYRARVISENFNKQQTSDLLINYIFLGF